jgi:methylenetetrahydrofolate dehydrogenase (NADP+)/methenyltetrahydrofolate cyclohydrolase
MKPVILDGRELSGILRKEMSRRVEELSKVGCRPGLVVVLVGDDPASAIYIRQKEKACNAVGIDSRVIRLDSTTEESKLLSLLDELNADAGIHGILVQLPLPSHIDTHRIIEAIDPGKDVDGFHPVNAGRLLAGREAFVSCTPLGIIRMLDHYQIPMSGREAVIIGRSNIVGKPMAILLMRENATVTVCHSRTADLAGHTRRADILVAAVGRAGLVTGDMVKEGAVVVDVGMNRTPEGKLTGEFSPDQATGELLLHAALPLHTNFEQDESCLKT